ncbi:MAG: M23 family metallopeptidase [Cycloclasticus sp.]
MQIILLTKGQRKTLRFSVGRVHLLTVLVSGLLLGLASYFIPLSGAEPLPSLANNNAQQELVVQRAEIQRLRNKTQHTLDGMALRIGQMQAQLTRLNAVGEHLAKKAKLNSSEFNFDQLPAIGSAEWKPLADSFSQGQLLGEIEQLDLKLSLREKQLELLTVFTADRKLLKEVRPAGLPVEKGWLSSYYGYRADPFSGKKAFHHGVDIAGKSGTAVLAAASGLVTIASKKSGYGFLIEVDHGGSYVTRYGHNKEILVKVGDLVKQGEVIAKMGSTGRSTGPHVHFEVLRNGKKVNPRKYLYSAR